MEIREFERFTKPFLKDVKVKVKSTNPRLLREIIGLSYELDEDGEGVVFLHFK